MPTVNICNLGRVQFPATSAMHLSVNMMPFIMGDGLSLPVHLRQYIPLIDACRLEKEQIGKVGYLSVMESIVASGTSQRRPGLHTEKHPSLRWGDGGWGSGQFDDSRHDGIYMASTVTGSCRAWNTHIKMPGKMGDCEHLRDVIEQTSQPVTMAENTLYWMTDSCPHESLPLPRASFRQWFRLVTHKISLWYENHSTRNPLGIDPACEVIRFDKFNT